MQNFSQSKSRPIAFTTPAGGVISGQGLLIGSLFVVAAAAAAAGDTFAAVVEGVVSLPKATGALTEGEVVYWDDTAKDVTATSTSNTKIGVVGLGGALSADTTVLVVLNGTA